MSYRKIAMRFGVGSVAVVASGSAFAAAPTTIAELTTGIDFASVATGILAIAGLMAAVYVTWKGAKMVIGALRTM